MGSIVASRYVLTAAHCVNNFDPESPSDKVEVYMGYKEFASYNRKETVEKVIIKHNYKDFDDTQMLDYNDFALLELQQDLDIRIFTPICLPEKVDGDYSLKNQTFPQWTFVYKNDGTRYLGAQNYTVIVDFDEALATIPSVKKVISQPS